VAGLALAIHAVVTYDKAEVVVEWTTASELNTVGFNLQRGETQMGPFEQINVELIPATSDTLTGSSYSYIDNHVQAGTTYFYILEEIESTGNANHHGPIAVEAGSPAKADLLTAASLIFGATIFAIFFLRQPKHSELTSQPHEQV
jgi:hypothetical protein